MKTLEVEWIERKRATINVPDTYDPHPHRDELTAMVGEIASDDVIEDSRDELTWRLTEYDPDAPVLVAVDPDTVLCTATLVPSGKADAIPLRQWPTPTLRRVILAEAVDYLNAKGELLQANTTARIEDRYPVIRPGTRPYVAWLLVSPVH